MKHSLVASHPGVDEPRAFSTVYVVASALGAISPIIATANTERMIIFTTIEFSTEK